MARNTLKSLADPERFERPTLRFVVSGEAFDFNGCCLLDASFRAIKAGSRGAGNTASTPDHFDRARIIMADQALPSIADIRQRLKCDPDTGTIWRWTGLRWIPAFTATDSDGYRIGACCKKPMKAHRVIWALHYGEWPAGEIDHINRDRADNRIANLRITTRSENVCNTGLRSTNTSGYPGVSWHRGKGRWRAAIRLNGRKIHLGYFDQAEAAGAAYAAARAS